MKKEELDKLNKIKCDICGKEFDLWDEQEGLKLDRYFGYGSLFDYKHLKCNICCECTDKLLCEMISKLNSVEVFEEYRDDNPTTNQESLEDLKRLAKLIKKEYRKFEQEQKNKIEK